MNREQEASLEWLRAAWRGGGSARPLLDRLIELGQMDEAAVLAGLTLASDDCPDRDEIERLLQRTGNPPPGWSEAVLAFSRDPTIESWDSLMQFTPDRVYYQRVRNTLRVLRNLGTEPNALFRCATRMGTFPDAFELVQSGDVDPDTVVEHAYEAQVGARGLWLGIAAEAAFARGDMLSTVRLLKMAYEQGSDIGPEMSAMAIRHDASPELHEMLDKIGVPKFK